MPGDHPLTFAIIAMVVGVAIPICVLMVSPQLNQAGEPGPSLTWREYLRTWLSYLWSHRWRIGLFVVSLVVLVVATTVVPRWNEVIGVLGGLPLVPLFGLWVVARNPRPVASLSSMAINVSVGAAIAIWFIVAFSWSVAYFRLNEDWVTGLAPLGVAWAATFIAIFAMSAAIKRSNT